MVFLITFTQHQVLIYLASTLFLGGNYILFRRRSQVGGFDFNSSHFYIGLIFSLMTSFAFINLGFKSSSQENLYFEEDPDPVIELLMPRTKHEKKKATPKPKKVDVRKIKEIILIDIVADIEEPAEVQVVTPKENTEAPVVQTGIEEPPPIVAPVIKEESDEVIVIAEQMPRFPGCEEIDGSNKEKEACAKEKMLQYIYKNLNYPAIASNNQVQGMAILQFVVGKDGMIRDLAILRDPGAGCGQAAYNVIEAMNNLPEKWTPGKQRGRSVSVRYTLPVKFKLK